jgi:transcriptional regulator with XRE-family HTH domain
MNGNTLKEARQKKKWTQADAASALGVTQAYLSMLESGHRAVSKALERKALKTMNLPPTALPLQAGFPSLGSVSQKKDFTVELGTLGYPGFEYLSARPRRNPAAVLLDALDQPDLDARVAEALPWLALTYFDMDWDWLVRNTKLRDLQNRLAFAVAVASQVAEEKNDNERAQRLQTHVEMLERARLAREDTFCHDSMTQAEKAWLREHRTTTAAHWNLLTDMKASQLPYAS